jgi:hypothetical protein
VAFARAFARALASHPEAAGRHVAGPKTEQTLQATGRRRGSYSGNGSKAAPGTAAARARAPGPARGAAPREPIARTASANAAPFGILCDSAGARLSPERLGGVSEGCVPPSFGDRSAVWGTASRDAVVLGAPCARRARARFLVSALYARRRSATGRRRGATIGPSGSGAVVFGCVCPRNESPHNTGGRYWGLQSPRCRAEESLGRACR